MAGKIEKCDTCEGEGVIVTAIMNNIDTLKNVNWENVNADEIDVMLSSDGKYWDVVIGCEGVLHYLSEEKAIAISNKIFKKATKENLKSALKL